MYAAALGFQAPPPPLPSSEILEAFRAARVHNRVSVLDPKADEFEGAVMAFTDGRVDLRQVISSFAGVVKGFQDTARAAMRVDLLSRETRSAVDSALESIVDEFEGSFTRVNNALRDFEFTSDAPEAAQFLLEARERMDRLSDFWRTAVSAVEKPISGPRMS